LDLNQLCSFSALTVSFDWRSTCHGDLGTISSFADWARLIEPKAWMMRGQPKLVSIEQDIAA
tara:strand:+ start:2597 stop:2782 length:186 start_codon:yes stop_codon:yes gene_type:complete